jgi:two-component system, LytTR family, sensor kinase
MINRYAKFKISSHILFWLCSIIFAISAFYVASDHQLSLNSDLILQALTPNIGFAFAVYLNLYLLIPKFLKTKNYIFYTFWLLITLAFSAILIQCIFIFILQTKGFTGQFIRMFSPHFFTAAFYVGVTSLFKFVKDWLQLQEMTLKITQIEREKLEAELNTLKSQLNPHFLFNSLNNIYSLALTNSPRTPEIILKLSDLMRHVLYESRENFIPVKDELNFLTNFIELQKIRLNNQIDIQYSVEGDVPEMRVIPLIFEPFIDNAFKHGLRNPATSPYIHVSIHFQSKIMRFRIENNFCNTPASKTPKSSGIGLKNIERRLEFLYAPGEYKYEINRTDNTFAIILEVELRK